MTVRIPRWALIAISVGAVAVVAFLIGRGSDDDNGSEPGEAASADERTVANPDRTIALTRDGDRIERIGELNAETANPDAARATFGDESVVSPAGDLCEVEWGEIGLQINFANFGGADACGRQGAVATADIGSEEGVEEGWSTDAGLALGDSEGELENLYPRATPPEFVAPEPKYRGDRLVLASTYTPFGEGGDTPTLTAVLSGGEVIAFEIYVGAAGE